MCGLLQLRVVCTHGDGGAVRAATQQKDRQEEGSWCVTLCHAHLIVVMRPTARCETDLNGWVSVVWCAGAGA